MTRSAATWDLGPDDVLAFWFGDGPTNTDDIERCMRRWFGGDREADRAIRDRFSSAVTAAAAHELDDLARNCARQARADHRARSVSAQPSPRQRRRVCARRSRAHADPGRARRKRRSRTRAPGAHVFLYAARALRVARRSNAVSYAVRAPRQSRRRTTICAQRWPNRSTTHDNIAISLPSSDGFPIATPRSNDTALPRRSRSSHRAGRRLGNRGLGSGRSITIQERD